MGRLESIVSFFDHLSGLFQLRKAPTDTNTTAQIEFLERMPPPKVTLDEIVKRGQQVQKNIESQNAKYQEQIDRDALEEATRQLLPIDHKLR
jgi:hypothetical protein